MIAAITAAALLARSQLRSAALLAAATAAPLIALGGIRIVVLAQVLESIDPRQQAESVSGITYSAIGAGTGLILLPIAFGIAALIASRSTGNRTQAAPPSALRRPPKLPLTYVIDREDEPVSEAYG